MARAVAGPDYKIDIVCEMFGNPGESGIDEGERRVTIACLGAVVARCSMAAMTKGAGFGRGVGIVEGVGMDVCRKITASITHAERCNET